VSEFPKKEIRHFRIIQTAILSSHFFTLNSCTLIRLFCFSKLFDFFERDVYNFWLWEQEPVKGGEEAMKRTVSTILSFVMIVIFAAALFGCGADIKAENEKLKAENNTLKSDIDKLKIEVQKLKEGMEAVQKAAAEKDATIGTMKAENEAFKKQVEDLKAQLTKKKK
jgi:cell division protein FtsB